MSLNFTNLVSLINSNIKANDTSYPLAEKVIDINKALDKVWSIIFKSNGRWQWDDSNHSNYPIISTALVSGQRDYAFTTDETGNLVLDIYKVVLKMGDQTGDVYTELDVVDQQSDEDMAGFYDGLNITGIPSRYDKTANGIFLDVIPNYNVNHGLKVYINREGSYFLVTDTTKKAGFAGLFHEYLALSPSYDYAVRNSLVNANAFKNDMIVMEAEIKKYYRDRSKDESLRITGEQINSV